MTTKNKTNIEAYFFISIANGQIDVNFCGDTDVLSAAFAQLIVGKIKEGADVKKILVDAIGVSAGILRDDYTIITEKGNIVPKKSKKSQKEQ
jgi:pyridoxal/pyridoxine/pyridoxamine kinase